MTTEDRDRLRAIRTLPSLVKYLRDELDWPIESTDNFDDLIFTWETEELGIDLKTSAKIQYIKQLRPLTSDQPWGIFFAMFEPKRLPVVALRRILSSLALKKRQSAAQAERPAWQKDDLLFISAYGEDEQRHITFAHFSESPGTGDLPVLRVLGWDGRDTPLHIDHVHSTLTSKLRWPGDPSDLESWRKSWSSAFRLRPREVITTSRQLAIRLAELAGDIRRRVNSVLAEETQHGPMRRLMKAFRKALIHDLDEDDFADMYAQTVAYGLLSARISHYSPDDGGSAALVADDVAELVPVTNPFLKELMATFLSVGGRRALIDFDELGVNDVVETLRDANMAAVLRDFGDKAQKDDPVFYFYEDFIHEYDPQKRKRRGIYFTPLPVVSFIVRSVDEILRTEFGLEDGLADTSTWGTIAKRHKGLKIPDGVSPDEPFVQILDPACGTGTFLVEVIDLIYRTMARKWEAQGRTRMFDIPKLWNEYVAQDLLPRLYGFELMMAPYTIAHMKIGLKLFETGYTFGSEERAQIYLTNSLEPPQDFSDTFEQMAPLLAHEAQAVNAVKRQQRFTVVIGNPPYAALSSNLTPECRTVVDAYRAVAGVPIRERGMLQFEKNIQDDYVKFLAKSGQFICASGVGALGFITNHSYLDGPTLRGMRWHMASSYNRLTFLDLHGNANKKEEAPDGRLDENVFDIRQGVAICLLRRSAQGDDDALGDVERADLWGRRDEKYSCLLGHNVLTVAAEEVRLTAPNYYFVADAGVGADLWECGVPLPAVFVKYSTGTETGFDRLLMDFDGNALEAKIREFADAAIPTSQIIEKYRISGGHAEFLLGQRASFDLDNASEYVRPFQFRPFDFRYAYLKKALLKTNSFNVMTELSAAHPGLVATRQTKERFGVFATAGFCGHKCTSGYDRSYIFPSQIHGPGALDGCEQSGISTTFMALVVKALKTLPRGGRPEIDGERVFHYLYAVLCAPSYMQLFRTQLRREFPRVLIPKNAGLFTELGSLGADLVAVHLLDRDYAFASWNCGEPRRVCPLEASTAHFEGPEDTTVAASYPRYQSGGVYVNAVARFVPIPEPVWQFHIGGFQVCEKWLKDRRSRVLTKEDIEHYCRILAAIQEAMRLMGEIDEVINAHGGWPDAFVTSK